MQLLDSLGCPGIGRALTLERPLELGAAPLQLGDAIVELAPHVECRGGPLLRLPYQLRGAIALAVENLDLLGQRRGPLLGGTRGERELLVLLLEALQLGLELPDAGVLGSPLLGLLVLVPPGPYEGGEDLSVWLIFGAQGSEEQALGGMGAGEVLQLLRREVLEGGEGLGWDLLLYGGLESAPGGSVLRDLALLRAGARRQRPTCG